MQTVTGPIRLSGHRQEEIHIPVPLGGPNGFIVIINHEVTLDANFCSAYRTTINNNS